MTEKKLWTIYRVNWVFLGKLCASVPGDPEIVKEWLKSRRPKVRPPGGKSINEVQEEVFATLAESTEEEEVSGLVFQRESGYLCLRAGTIRAHLKDCARILSAQYVGKIKGERSFSTKVINGVYPDETQYWIPILDIEGHRLTQHHGRHEKPVHVRGPRGEQMNCLKVFEYVDGARVDFVLKVLGDSVPLSDLNILMSYGGVHGYGGERGDGEGRYSHTIEVVE